MKVRTTFGEDFNCKYEWNCYCRAGDYGKAASLSDRRIVFFEAFPRNPECSPRGEGKTIEEAEEECWQQYQRMLTCNHEMERRGRTDEYGYCKHCSYFAKVFEPLTKCCKCGRPTAYATDILHRHYCKRCCRTMPSKVRHYWMCHIRLPRKIKKYVKQGISICWYGTRNRPGTMEVCSLSFKGEKNLLCIGVGIGMRKSVKKLVDIANGKRIRRKQK